MPNFNRYLNKDHPWQSNRGFIHNFDQAAERQFFCPQYSSLSAPSGNRLQSSHIKSGQYLPYPVMPDQVKVGLRSQEQEITLQNNLPHNMIRGMALKRNLAQQRLRPVLVPLDQYFIHPCQVGIPHGLTALGQGISRPNQCYQIVMYPVQSFNMPFYQEVYSSPNQNVTSCQQNTGFTESHDAHLPLFKVHYIQRPFPPAPVMKEPSVGLRQMPGCSSEIAQSFSSNKNNSGKYEFSYSCEQEKNKERSDCVQKSRSTGTKIPVLNLPDQRPVSSLRHTSEETALEETSTKITLDMLPDIALLQILSYLSTPDLVIRARLTCRRLYELSHDPSLWKVVSISNVENYGKNTFLPGLLEQDCYIFGRQDPQEFEEDEMIEGKELDIGSLNAIQEDMNCQTKRNEFSAVNSEWTEKNTQGTLDFRQIEQSAITAENHTIERNNWTALCSDRVRESREFSTSMDLTNKTYRNVGEIEKNHTQHLKGRTETHSSYQSGEKTMNFAIETDRPHKTSEGRMETANADHSDVNDRNVFLLYQTDISDDIWEECAEKGKHKNQDEDKTDRIRQNQPERKNVESAERMHGSKLGGMTLHCKSMKHIKTEKENISMNTMRSVYHCNVEGIEANQSQGIAHGLYAQGHDEVKCSETSVAHPVYGRDEAALTNDKKSVIEGKKQVKDYIQELTVNNEAQVAPVYFSIRANSKNDITVTMNHGLNFSNDLIVCPRLSKLVISHVRFEPTILSMVARHSWLTQLSVTILNKRTRFCLRIKEDELVRCYNTFRTLKHLKKFKFVFPTSSGFSNNLLNNSLYFNTGLFYTAMKRFFEEATDLEEIVVSDMSDQIMGTILDKCVKLKSLTISAHSLTIRAFISHGQSLKSTGLQSLTINCCLSMLDCHMMDTIAEAFPNLKSVNLTGSKVTGDGLQVLLKRCPKLEAVHLHKRYEDFPRSAKKYVFSSAFLSSLCVPGRTPLRELSVQAELDDLFIQKLCACNTTLQSVTLVHCPNITDASLDTMAELCPNLSYVSINQEKSAVTARGVFNLMQKNSVTSIKISSVTNKGRFVPFFSGSNITNSRNPIDKFVNHNGSKAYRHNAKALVNHSDRENSHAQYPDNRGITRNIRNYDCKEGSINADTSVAKSVSIKNSEHHRYETMHAVHGESEVKEFSLGRVPQMTSEDMMVLVRVCPHLEELDLSGCLRLQDDSVEIILRQCPKLRTLKLDRQARGVRHKPCRLTDSTLNTIVQLGTNIEYLTVTQCYNFTPSALATTLCRARALRTLTITVGRLHVTKNFHEVAKALWRLSEKSRTAFSTDVNVGFRVDLQDNGRGALVHATRLRPRQETAC